MLRLLLAALLIVLLGYGFIEARPLLIGPSLTVSSPTPYASVADGIVTVSGRAARTVALSLDGSPLLPEANGNFIAVLALPHGSSILTLSATDRFGRSVYKTRTVYVP